MKLVMIAHKVIPGEKHFRWRAGEITRLEGFTDAVFALAVTLLVVSLEAPKTFSELVAAMKGFVAFGICFTILIWAWYHHYIYSRRYGLQTAYAVFLNSVLLFVLLFYVYPLKFLFSLFIGQVSGGLLAPPHREAEDIINLAQVPALMIIYSLGFAAVFGVFALLYRHAYSKRQELDLNGYESLVTRHAIVGHVGTSILGLAIGATALLVPVRYAGLSGYLYCLIGVYHTIIGTKFGKAETEMLQRLQSKEAQTSSANQEVC